MKIRDGSHILIVGDPSTGKSSLAHHLIGKIMHDNDIKELSIYAPDIDVINNVYSDFKDHVESDLEVILLKQKLALNFGCRYGQTDDLYPVDSYKTRAEETKRLVIIDSVPIDYNKGYNEINELLMNGRHYRCTTIFISARRLLPESMSNMDVVFITKIDDPKKSRQISKYYMGQKQYDLCIRNTPIVISCCHSRSGPIVENYDFPLLNVQCMKMYKYLKIIPTDIRYNYA